MQWAVTDVPAFLDSADTWMDSATSTSVNEMRIFVPALRHEIVVFPATRRVTSPRAHVTVGDVIVAVHLGMVAVPGQHHVYRCRWRGLAPLAQAAAEAAGTTAEWQLL